MNCNGKLDKRAFVLILSWGEQMSDQARVVFAWEVSNFFGWGIYGLNLMLHWPGSGLSALTPGEVVFPSDNNAATLLRERMDESLLFQAEILKNHSARAHIADPVLVGVANRLTRSRALNGIELAGSPTIGVAFIEDTAIDARQVSKVRDLAMMVVGSNWNRALLANAGINNLVTVFQGVDSDLFRPRRAKGWLAGRFKVFSGGKLEFRKGQDLVLQAFSAFAQRHDDALLVTSWQSPWPTLSSSFAANPALGSVKHRSDGSIDILAWAQGFRVDPARIIDLDRIPNCKMGAVLCEMDVALFPSRCEGGTNLAAMECIASGIPTIVSANSGHLDLIELANPFVLANQQPVRAKVPRFIGLEGWGESDVEEIVETLEQVYARRESAASCARRSAAILRTLTWKRQINQLHDVVQKLKPGRARTIVDEHFRMTD
jgi:glycosyltransferase involved in cell wall biosynthesis